ncbi:1-acyl-sn-glycerol-3-phosphate acyltransferase [Pigmentiphaga litoralis]|nr:lysophospholipid acyltransferase family protein [Pigmentiphaga litoralis]GGX16496.1 1-acyl-sn-glycerol-3-phosphate acyltransferase [Pigmentiphaga litoralis]
MLHLLRFLIRIVAVILWILLGFAILLVYYQWAPIPRRDALYKWWSTVMLRICGIRVDVIGEPLPFGSGLLIANHVSWIDIFVLCSRRATIFVAKREIRQWPVLGWLVALVGTIFIERGNRKAVTNVGIQMARRFEKSQLVGLFPEGTTSEGMDVLPFHAGLFEPALQSGVAIQPVALRYRLRGQRSSFASYVGDESLIANAWRVLGESGVSVDVVYLPPIRRSDSEAGYGSRHELSEMTRRAIREQVVEGEFARQSA